MYKDSFGDRCEEPMHCNDVDIDDDIDVEIDDDNVVDIDDDMDVDINDYNDVDIDDDNDVDTHQQACLKIGLETVVKMCKDAAG